jgi:glyoxylase-like metal-dependent hydrolase (beta-lactamase superfamily II)
MIFEQIQYGGLKNFAYVIGDRDGGEGAVVDPPPDLARVYKTIKKFKLKINYIFNTHGHFDHTQGNHELKKSTGARIVAHERSRGGQDVQVDDGDELKIGGLTARIIYTPGHSKDSMCILVGKHLFTGDTLFINECGLSQDSEELWGSLFNKIWNLPDDTIICPGHLYGPALIETLGEQKKNNYTLKPRSKKEFVKFMLEP